MPSFEYKAVDKTGRPVRAVQCGGPLGAYFPPALFDTPYDYEAFAAKDGLIGHGGIVVFDDTVYMAAQAITPFIGKGNPAFIGPGHPDFGKKENPSLEDHIVAAVQQLLREYKVDPTLVQSRVTGTCAAGSSTRSTESAAPRSRTSARV